MEYYFLFTLAGVWVLFGMIQDLKTTEISNWLNYSLLAFALAYRAFYSIASGDGRLLMFGLLGVGLFFIIGNLLYYSRMFAGGDAKMLFGLGAVLPFESWSDLLYIGGGFVILIFAVGVLYTLIYSGVLVLNHKKKFYNEFKKEFFEGRRLFLIFVLGALGLLIFGGIAGIMQAVILGILFLVWPMFYFYAHAVERVCMIKLKKPSELIEGDWLVDDVRVGRDRIEKSVHGLLRRDIEMLRKAKKKVWIKEGVPFSPAFLIALVIFGVWYFGF